MVKHSLSEFESIGENYGQILQKTMNIQTVDEFLKHSVEEIHKKADIDIERVEQWRDLIDLFRVPNLTARECELLYNSNINSVEELSHRQSLRIFYKLREIDAETRFIVLSFPTFAQIDEWIYFAKMMSKRIKFGLNIPLILFPMINIDIASEFKKFSIYTAEDLLDKQDQIKNVPKKVGIKPYRYHHLLDMIELVEIPGIDVYFATLLQKAGFNTVKILRNTPVDKIFEAVSNIQATEKDIPEKFTKDLIEEIKTNLEAH